DLTGHEVPPMVQLAVHHDAGTDPGPYRDEGTGAVAPGGAAPMLSEDRQVDVVFHDHRHTERAPQDFRDGHLRPSLEIWRESDDDAAVAIDDAGRAGGDRQQAGERDV